MSTLRLTPAEATIFNALPATAKGEWTVEAETLTYEDSPERRDIRFELMQVSDPEILRFRTVVAKMKTMEEFMEATKTFDLTKISDKDFSQLLFALGPTAMGLMIEDFLSNKPTADDLEKVAAFSELRHGMLESLNQYSSTNS